MEALEQVHFLLANWNNYGSARRKKIFSKLSRAKAEELYLRLFAADQKQILSFLPAVEQRSWLRLLAPDDAANVIRLFSSDEQTNALSQLDENTRRDVEALLAFAEDKAGGWMNPQFVRLRDDMRVDVAIAYIRAQAASPAETINYAYVMNANQTLVGAVSYRELLLAPADKKMQEIMSKDLVTVAVDASAESAAQIFSTSGHTALPVVDTDGKMQGILTIDDMVRVAQDNATQDIHKLGGTAALDLPYLNTRIIDLVRKRVGWLTLLFVGGMLTANAIGHYEHSLERAVVLALFIPLIISSGGNSGSQATSLIVRALALGELRAKDWWKVLGRELTAGLILGLILGVLGWLRVWLLPDAANNGIAMTKIALTVSISLVGIVLWGNVAGAMLPFALRRFNFDPATASAPFVSTLVDVTGLLIYFTTASLIVGI